MTTTRTRKEARYIKTMTTLQTRWNNPIDEPWDYVRDWSDEELQRRTEDTLRQIRFDKDWPELIFKPILVFVGLLICLFVGLGVLGLLLFGIRQIF